MKRNIIFKNLLYQNSEDVKQIADIINFQTISNYKADKYKDDFKI